MALHHYDDLEAFLADIGFGLETMPQPQQTSATLSMPYTVVTSPEEGTSSGATGTLSAGAVEDWDGDRERRLRRKISNRESARRSRARKQRHLGEQRAEAALLRASNRDLAARLRSTRARAALVSLTNARLRVEAQALGRRLVAARRALALRQLYAAAGNAGLEMQTLA